MILKKKKYLKKASLKLINLRKTFFLNDNKKMYENKIR